MTNPAPLHAGVTLYNGKIHFANGYAYIELSFLPAWALLISDPQLTGVVNLAVLSQTAAALAANHQEGNVVSLRGIMLVQAVNGQTVHVLHIG